VKVGGPTIKVLAEPNPYYEKLAAVERDARE
jgi:hypothetical protein